MENLRTLTTVLEIQRKALEGARRNNLAWAWTGFVLSLLFFPPRP
jgi:hypothetical protein